MPSKLKTRPRTLTFQVTFFVERDEDCYHAWAPMLSGLHADGATTSEALQHARELAQLYLEVLIEDGDPIPLGPDTDKTEAIPPKVTIFRESVTIPAA